ncbi:MAG: methylenetetrahydrofolate reductase [Planktomarina sp.]
MRAQFSYEFFSPKTVKAAFNLSRASAALDVYGPSFTSVTCGTGNGSPGLTQETLSAVAGTMTCPLAAHVACANFTADDLKERAKGHVAKGITRAVAVRGDNGQDALVTVPQLTTILRDAGMDVYVGAYPETHPKAASPEACLDALKAKQDAGATAAISQFFFDADIFLAFRDRAVAAGITLDLIPGILPVVNWPAAERMAAQCGTQIAPDLAEGFARAAREDRAALMATAHAAEVCEKLTAGGVDHLHFYTMNRAKPVTDILEALGYGPSQDHRLAA